MAARHILIVDDDIEIGESIAGIVEDMGFEATAVTSGAEFRAAYDDRTPDAIVMDIVMPGEDGVELLGWLTDCDCPAPVVLVSGYDPLYRRSARLLGQAGGLTVAALAKPFRTGDLEALLMRWHAGPAGPIIRPVALAE